jgi:protein required for attachment to host cells
LRVPHKKGANAMKPTRTWIVIADGARARIARTTGRGRPIEPAFDHEFAAPHAPTKDFVSDRPGSNSDSGGPGVHSYAPRTDRREYEKTLFAGDVAEVVNKAADEKAFDRLVLVAPPATLGRLRAAINERMRPLIAAEVGKDLTKVPLHALHEHLEEVLPR